MEGCNKSRSYSYSYGDDMMQIERYYGPSNSRPPTTATSYELRSYGASYSQGQMAYGNYTTNNMENRTNRDFQRKKGKSPSGSAYAKSWSFGDPEFQRKKRVASYKRYGIEGKVKGTFRKSFRWLKDRYTQVVYGWS